MKTTRWTQAKKLSIAKTLISLKEYQIRKYEEMKSEDIKDALKKQSEWPIRIEKIWNASLTAHKKELEEYQAMRDELLGITP